jgi:vitamin B12 transporter
MSYRYLRPRQLGRAILAFFALGTAAIAADGSTDLATIVVTATRTPTRINEIVADVTVIDRAAIESAGPTTLPALLARQPGLHMADNGGSGKSASIFTRGTNSGHTLLLIDGVPFGSATTGGPTLHNLPLSQIERIEILRGPASALYGSDAIGGVIQVFTRRGEGQSRIDAYAGIGSRDSSDFRLGYSGSSGPWSFSLAKADFRTAGFSVAADPVRYRTAIGSVPSPDADGYRNSSLSGRVSLQLAAGHELQASVLEASSRSAYDGGGVAIDAFNNDKTRVYSVQMRNRVHRNWTSTLRAGQGEDNSSSFAPARSQFATTQKQLTWQNDLQLPVGGLMLAMENLDQGIVSTTNYPIRERQVRSAIVGYQVNFGAHGLQASLRHDRNSQFGAHRTGALAYGYRIAPEWQLRLAQGTAFKAPSFNQLYFPGFGNANLQPERAWNREAGVAWDNGRQRALLTHYDNRIENLISGSPPVNIGKARIRGAGLSASLVAGAWSADGGLDVMQPVDAANGNRLQRRPAEMLKAAATYAPPGWKGGGELVAVGRRYDTTTQGRAMGGYALANLHGSYDIDKDWTLEARLNNLFGRVYENAWAYAVPGREFFLGLRYAPK